MHIASPTISHFLKENTLSSEEMLSIRQQIMSMPQDDGRIAFLGDEIISQNFSISHSGDGYIVSGAFTQHGFVNVAKSLLGQRFSIIKRIENNGLEIKKDYTGLANLLPYGLYNFAYSGWITPEFRAGLDISGHFIHPLEDIFNSDVKKCFIHLGNNDLLKEYYSPSGVASGIIDIHNDLRERGITTYGSTILQNGASYGDSSLREKIVETNSFLKNLFNQSQIDFIDFYNYQELYTDGAYSGAAKPQCTIDGHLPSVYMGFKLGSGLANFLNDKIGSLPITIPPPLSKAWISSNPYMLTKKILHYGDYQEGNFSSIYGKYSGYCSGHSSSFLGRLDSGSFSKANITGNILSTNLSGDVFVRNYLYGNLSGFTGHLSGSYGYALHIPINTLTGSKTGDFSGLYRGYASGNFKNLSGEIKNGQFSGASSYSKIDGFLSGINGFKAYLDGSFSDFIGYFSGEKKRPNVVNQKPISGLSDGWSYLSSSRPEGLYTSVSTGAMGVGNWQNISMSSGGFIANIVTGVNIYRGRKIKACADIILENNSGFYNLDCGVIMMRDFALPQVTSCMYGNSLGGSFGETGCILPPIDNFSGFFISPEVVVPDDCFEIRYFIGHPQQTGMSGGDFKFRRAGVFTSDYSSNTDSLSL